MHLNTNDSKVRVSSLPTCEFSDCGVSRMGGSPEKFCPRSDEAKGQFVIEFEPLQADERGEDEVGERGRRRRIGIRDRGKTALAVSPRIGAAAELQETEVQDLAMDGHGRHEMRK